MTQFVRARSSEQKLQRMNEIMDITDQLFSEYTYHEITLTTIAAALGWSRGNLYKYVTTKEEIFLELYLRKQTDYFAAITATFSNKETLTDEQFSTLWAEILGSHQDYLNYYGILATIIETNVTVERLAEFKKNVMNDIDDVLTILEHHCKCSSEEAAQLFWTLLFHATGLNNSCSMNPIIIEAMKMADLPIRTPNFVKEFQQFMAMCLKNYSSESI